VITIGSESDCMLPALLQRREKGVTMFKINKDVRVVLLVVLIVGVGMLSSTMAGATSSPSAASEGMLIGGSDCSDFMNGLSVGLAVGGLLGCVACAFGALGARALALFC
jgi:hypothetical protein